ncbi:hypothetical protein [Nocardioides sp.]|uniref:hypothetical protein n=1 Tax=Nocardioides sp. TaxID=35761 RepID=UPI003562513D
MPRKNREFVLDVIESREARPARFEPERVLRGSLVPEAEESLSALKATKGADKVLKKFPGILDLDLWFPMATFTVGAKYGRAKYLDIWDADHFDDFTDMQSCLDADRAWFSSSEHAFWGSATTKTGRINCYFEAPDEGRYNCHVRLQSHGGPAVVECLIDDSSFGNLPVDGLIDQPHLADLGPGGHHFRIRQVSGSFFFLSLRVWRVG